MKNVSKAVLQQLDEVNAHDLPLRHIAEGIVRGKGRSWGWGDENGWNEDEESRAEWRGRGEWRLLEYKIVIKYLS